MFECNDNETWLDMRVGEIGLVRGGLRRLNGDRADAHNIQYGIVIGFADWSELVIETPGGVPPQVRRLRTEIGFDYVNVTVRRTEDGLEGIALWRNGCAAIPLERATTVSAESCQGALT